MTIALQLDATGFNALQAEAAELGLTPEQLANEIVKRHLQVRTETSKAADDNAFRAAMTASMIDNEELLRRLAK